MLPLAPPRESKGVQSTSYQFLRSSDYYMHIAAMTSKNIHAAGRSLLCLYGPRTQGLTSDNYYFTMAFDDQEL